MLRFLMIGTSADLLVAFVGATGFHLTMGLAWLDAFVDAAMVMTGNGPRHQATGGAAKVFLSTYALAGGTAYVIVVALILAPALHRLLHIFHLRAPEDT
jgi:hypothetical protein